MGEMGRDRVSHVVRRRDGNDVGLAGERALESDRDPGIFAGQPHVYAEADSLGGDTARLLDGLKGHQPRVVVNSTVIAPLDRSASGQD